jgi:hypothetical protein
MGETDEQSSGRPLTPSQERLVRLWDEHIKGEFVTRNTEDTLKTMLGGCVRQPRR